MKKTSLLIASFLLVFGLNRAQASSLTAYSSGEVHYLGLIKVYDASLYVGEPAGSIEILSPAVSKCLELDYHVSLETEDFVKSAETVLSRQLPKQDLETLKPHIDRLHSSYKPVAKGDRYRLCYDADQETTVLALNDQELVSIASREFSRAYFGIWLNPDNPLDSSLQQDLTQPREN